MFVDPVMHPKSLHIRGSSIYMQLLSYSLLMQMSFKMLLQLTLWSLPWGFNKLTKAN